MDSFGPFHHPNNTQNSPELAQPTLQRKHGNFQTDFAVSHGSRRLYLLKLISISLVWIHAGHVMLCSWTHLDPFKIPNTYQKQPTAVGPAHINHTESMAIFSQFLASSMDTMDCICWNSSVSFCCGSIMAIQCLAGLDMFHLFFHPKHPNISLSDLAVPTQKAWQFWDSYWTFPWIQWTVIAETHQ